MADPLFIEDLVAKVISGNLRIPSFQRGFIWDPDRVAHLMDSIFKGFPFGALLFWRTKTPLLTERDLGPFALPNNDPDYPLDYVLDGQQRATSIFGVFQTQLQPKPGEDASWTNIYFDLHAKPTAQDSQFLHVSPAEVDPRRHFPLRILFDPPNYRQFLKQMDDSIAEKVDQLYKRFTTAKIPVQTFSTDDRAAVAIVFERINRLGVELDTLQLLSAWSWSEDFDLQERFAELAEELSPYGFKDVGEDSDLLLRCCAAIIASDASPTTIINLRGSEVRNRFLEVRAGIRGAIDFLRSHFSAESAEALPYTQILIPLSAFFATSTEQGSHPSLHQREALVKWIWRTFFTRRYSKRLEQLNEDIVEVIKLRDGEPHALGGFPHALDASFFTTNAFSTRNVNAKTFILLLANERPIDFVTGAPIAVGEVLRAANKREYHHLYPRAFLKASGISDTKIDALANICMLPRASNNRLGGVSPAQYRSCLIGEPQLSEALARAHISATLFEEDYDAFVSERATALAARAARLME